MNSQLYNELYLERVFDKISKEFRKICAESDFLEDEDDIVLVLKGVKDKKLVEGNLPSIHLEIRNCLSHQRKISSFKLKNYLETAKTFFTDRNVGDKYLSYLDKIIK